MNSKIRDALQYCPNLPTPPKIALRILELSRDPDVDLALLAELLTKDPALASRILRASNSALFANRRRSSNLRQAMVVIGLNATITLALSFSLAETFNNDPQAEQGRRRIWQRALISASASRFLGQYMGSRDLEELFLAALLQDIGILALDAALPELYSPLIQKSWEHEQLLQREREILGTDHGEIGSWLMEHWGLPERLALISTQVHKPNSESILEKNRLFVGIIAVAGEMADLFMSTDIAHKTERVAELAVELLHIPRTALEPLLTEIAKMLPEVASLYDTEIISTRMATGVIDQAREILAAHNLRLIHEVTEQQKKIQDLEHSTQSLQNTVGRDALTGLHNRRYFDQVLETEFVLATESGWPLTVGFIDLDYFKAVNDTYGHLSGDKVLAHVAQILTQHLRKRDFIMRYGGDEFVTLLPGTGLQQAHAIFERLRDYIARVVYPGHSGGQFSITASIGLASHMDGMQRFSSTLELMEAADQALYRAKHLGRNRLAIDTTLLD